jgi:hypothetical protein
VRTTYRGRTVTACPPPNHGTQVLECLNIRPGPPGALARPRQPSFPAHRPMGSVWASRAHNSQERRVRARAVEGYPLAGWGHNSARTLHHFAEAMKRAAADRAVRRGVIARDSRSSLITTPVQ